MAGLVGSLTLTRDNSKRFPHVIIQHDDVSSLHLVAIEAAVTNVGRESGTLHIDTEPVATPGHAGHRVTVRTAVAERRQQSELAALILGCSTIVSRAPGMNRNSEPYLHVRADRIAGTTMDAYYSLPEDLRKAFEAFVTKPGSGERDRLESELLDATASPGGYETGRRHPLIPLTDVPLIEGFFIDAIENNRTAGRSSREMANFALRSNSFRTHQTLVRTLTRRFPGREIYTSAGETGLRSRREVITEMFHEYRRNAGDENRRGLLLLDILPVVRAFTGSGAVLQEVRAEAARKGASSPNISEFNKIIELMLTEGLAAPDWHLTNALESTVTQMLTSRRPGAGNAGELTRERAALVWLAALGKVDRFSDPEVLTRVGEQIFAPYGTWGSEQRAIAKLLVRSKQLSQSPAIVEAHQDLLGAKKSGAARSVIDAAQMSYAKATQQVGLLSGLATEATNALVFGLLDQVTPKLASASGEDRGVHSAARLFGELIANIAITDGAGGVNSNDYQRLLGVARTPGLPAHLRAHVCSRIQEQIADLSKDHVQFVQRAVVDIYETAFGTSPGDTGIDTKRVAAVLRPAARIVRDRGPEFFEGISPEFIGVTELYAESVRLIERRLGSAKGQKAESRVDQQNATAALQELRFIQGQHAEHLQLERVREEPARYYHWLVGKLKGVAQSLESDLALRLGHRPHELVELRDRVRSFSELQPAIGEKPAPGHLLDATGLTEFLDDFYHRIEGREAFSCRAARRLGSEFRQVLLHHMPGQLVSHMLARQRAETPLGRALAQQAKALGIKASSPPSIA